MYKGSFRRINKTDLLNSISHEQVFLQFLGIYPEVGHKRYLSPFRSDKTPGCRFEWYNGRLYFVENSMFNNKLYWDIFDVVMYLHKCDFNTACQLIANQNNITLNTQVDTKQSNKFRPEVRFDFIPWEENNLFGISNDQLLSENIYKVSNYYIRTQLGWSKNSLHDPTKTLCIAYHFPETNHVKLYFPNEVENKWYSNCSSKDVFGLNKVDYYASYSDLLVISKSQKDRIVLDYLLDIPSIAVQNEGSYIADETMDLLKTKFKNIVIIFDNDDTGFRQAQKLSEKYDIPYSIIECDKKDIYEMITAYNPTDIKTLIYANLS